MIFFLLLLMLGFQNWNMILVSFEECFNVDANSIFIVSLSVDSMNICLEIGKKKMCRRKKSDIKPVACIEISCWLQTLAFIQRIPSAHTMKWLEFFFLLLLRMHQRLCWKSVPLPFSKEFLECDTNACLSYLNM